MRLSQHFTLEELSDSPTALRLGIDNTPPADVVETLRQTARSLEQVRSLLGMKPLSVSSGFRCENLERVLCQKDFTAWCARRSVTSDAQAWRAYFNAKAHPKGWAADFTCAAFGSPLAIVRFLANETALQFDQLIMEGSWVHASFAPQLRREVKTATFSNGTPTYTSGV